MRWERRRERRVEGAARHGAAEGQGGGWEELYRLAMVAMAMASSRAAAGRASALGERGRPEEASAGCQGSSGIRIWRRREQGGAWRGDRTRGGNEARALLHGYHGALSSNTW